MADRYEEKKENSLGKVMNNLKQKKKLTDAELKEKKEKRIKQLKIKRKQLRIALRERTLKYEEEYKLQQQNLIKMRRDARKENFFFREAEPKVVFVIRLKGINKLPPKVKSVFRLLRLYQVHNGVFVKLNKASKQLLKIVDPYVTYGYTTLSTIRKLLYKRGYIRMGKKRRNFRKKIINNDDISEALGKYGIHGIEDMIYQIFTCGPYFRKVNRFLWTFKLKPPRKGFQAKRHGFNEARKGDWGNREYNINELIRRMI